MPVKSWQPSSFHKIPTNGKSTARRRCRLLRYSDSCLYCLKVMTSFCSNSATTSTSTTTLCSSSTAATIATKEELEVLVKFGEIEPEEKDRSLESS